MIKERLQIVTSVNSLFYLKNSNKKAVIGVPILVTFLKQSNHVSITEYCKNMQVPNS